MRFLTSAISLGSLSHAEKYSRSHLDGAHQSFRGTNALAATLVVHATENYYSLFRVHRAAHTTDLGANVSGNRTANVLFPVLVKNR